jgi:hypothetical protein
LFIHPALSGGLSTRMKPDKSFVFDKLIGLKLGFVGIFLLIRVSGLRVHGGCQMRRGVQVVLAAMVGAADSERGLAW